MDNSIKDRLKFIGKAYLTFIVLFIIVYAIRSGFDMPIVIKKQTATIYDQYKYSCFEEAEKRKIKPLLDPDYYNLILKEYANATKEEYNESAWYKWGMILQEHCPTVLYDLNKNRGK